MTEPADAGEGVPRQEPASRSGERSRPELATPAQAWELLRVIGQMTDVNSGGTHYSDRNTFGDATTTTVPPSVAEHFPTPDPNSSTEFSFYLIHMVGTNRGVVGTAKFDQHEFTSEDRGFATTVDYDVITDNGIDYRIERRVNTSEFGPHMVRPHDDGSSLEERLQAVIDRATALKAQFKEAHEFEASMGMPDVYRHEADEVTDFLKDKLKKD